MRNRMLVVTSLAMVMALPLAARAQSANLVTLYSFSGGSDGGAPLGGVVFDTQGKLYGTTVIGGPVSDICFLGCGTVFRLAGGEGIWTLNTLHTFIGGPTDVRTPYSHVTFDAAGHLYGMGVIGGANPCIDLLGCGGVFELLPSTGREVLIYSFTQTGGVTPQSGLTLHRGSLYGTTPFGPETKAFPGFGTVFSLSPTAAGGKIQWDYSTIHQFKGLKSGSEPGTADVVFDERGHAFIGVPFGGVNQTGAIFEMVPNATGTWDTKVIYSFPSTYGGGCCSYPSTLIFDTAGNLYGTTSYGGPGCSVFGCGTVFEVQRTTTGWQEITLYEFAGGGDGENPFSGLVFDSAGNLYGTTLYGGSGSCEDFAPHTGCGTIFKLTNSNGTWQKTTLYSFSGGSDGEYPGNGSLVLDSAGNLYGTTTGGFWIANTTGYGTVFELQP
jgi:hypothetical protein